MLGLIGLLLGVAVKRLGFLCVGTLLLAGCASGGATSAPIKAASSAPSTPSAPVVTGLGVYAYEVGGAVGTVTLPGVTNADVAGAIVLAKAPAPVYVTIAVDNRNGKANQAPAKVTAYTVSGAKVVYLSADKYLDSLDTSKLSIEDDNKIVAVYNKVNDPVSIGESRTVTMVGTEPLPVDIVRVTVSDAYGAEIQAVKK